MVPSYVHVMQVTRVAEWEQAVLLVQTSMNARKTFITALPVAAHVLIVLDLSRADATQGTLEMGLFVLT